MPFSLLAAPFKSLKRSFPIWPIAVDTDVMMTVLINIVIQINLPACFPTACVLPPIAACAFVRRRLAVPHDHPGRGALLGLFRT